MLQCPLSEPHSSKMPSSLQQKALQIQLLLPMASVSCLPPACRNTGQGPGGLRSPQPDEKYFGSPAQHYCLFSSRLRLHLWLSNPPTPSFTAG